MTTQRKFIPITTGGQNSLIGIALLWVLLTIVVYLRIYERYRGAGVKADDVLAAVGAILSFSTIGLNAAVFTSGVGWDFDPASNVYSDLVNNLPFIMKITFTFTLVYIGCLSCLKLSQTVLYLRIFGVKPRLRISIISFGVSIVLWGLAFNFLFVFMCKPIQQQWTIDRIGHCMDQITLLKCLIITNGITDLVIVLLPMKAIWQLKMEKVERAIVTGCFGLGIICCIISAVRLVLVFKVDLIGNLTGTSLTTFTLCTIELMLAGLCISVPVLRSFLRRIRGRVTASMNSKDVSRPQPEQNSWIPLEDIRDGKFQDKDSQNGTSADFATY